MDERRLEVFVAVAKELGFSRAAESLHLSQPAVSQVVARLEAELGTRLIDRSPHGVSLTAAGRAFEPHAEALLRSMAEARKAALAAGESIVGELHVGASQTIGDYVLPPVLSLFAATYPGVRLRVRVSNTERVARDLLAGDVDVGFVEGDRPLPRLEVRPFRQDELVVIVPPGHLWARRAHVTLEAFRREPLILREPGSGTRQVMEEHLRRVGVDPAELNVAMELSGTEAIKAAVQAGMGASVLSAAAIEKELRLHLVVARSIRGLAMPRSMSSSVVAGRALLPTARALLSLVHGG